MEEPDCEYKDKCTSKGMMCGSCKHNKGKKNYYESGTPYQPYYPIPYYPYYEPWKITYGQTSNETGTG